MGDVVSLKGARKAKARATRESESPGIQSFMLIHSP